MTVAEMADKLNLEVKQVQQLISSITDEARKADTDGRFSIERFKLAIKEMKKKGRNKPLKKKNRRPDYIVIDDYEPIWPQPTGFVRPPAEYSNTNWESYKENILNNTAHGKKLRY